MGPRDRLTRTRVRAGACAVLGAMVVMAIAAGCRRPADDDATASAARAATAEASARPPIDRLAEGELLEGTARAMGLPLPRGTIVETSTPQLVLAYCDQPAQSVEAFMKARATGGTVTAARGELTLANVPAPGNPSRLLEVRLNRVAGERGSRIAVRDVTPAPKKDLPNDEARLREVGIDKNGKLVDPLNSQ